MSLSYSKRERDLFIFLFVGQTASMKIYMYMNDIPKIHNTMKLPTQHSSSCGFCDTQAFLFKFAVNIFTTPIPSHACYSPAPKLIFSLLLLVYHSINYYILFYFDNLTLHVPTFNSNSIHTLTNKIKFKNYQNLFIYSRSQ